MLRKLFKSFKNYFNVSAKKTKKDYKPSKPFHVEPLEKQKVHTLGGARERNEQAIFIPSHMQKIKNKRRKLQAN